MNAKRLTAHRVVTTLVLLVSALASTLPAAPQASRELAPLSAPRAAQAAVQSDNCTALSGVINDYWPGVNSPTAGSTTIQLGARRSGGRGLDISAGDTLLVIQVFGADIDYSDSINYGDGPGGLTASGFISNANFVAGRYEYVEALSGVGAAGGTITVRGQGAGNGLLNSYVNADATGTQGPRRYQVVRVPRCAGATLTGNLTGVAFDGRTGGILALDVAGVLNMNGRTMDVSGLGYRGGGEGAQPWFCHRQLWYAQYYPHPGGPHPLGGDNNHCHAPKGEGLAGSPELVRVGNSSQSTPTSQRLPGGTWATGAPANGGGGGTFGTSGGGGGGNGGTGGKGNWGSNAVGGDRIDNGGFGGAAFPASFGVSRIVMGGGGGSGEGDTAGGYAPTFGGAGGGIALVRAGSVSGSGSVLADGQAGLGNTPTDAGGGGGAGGTIVFTVQNGGLSSLSLFARGGKGGNASSVYCHMFGGGGGGGRIFYSHPPATADTAAGPRGDSGCPDPVPASTAGTGQTINPDDIPGNPPFEIIGPFGKSAPANGASNQPASVTLSWSAPVTGTVNHYRYCAATTTGCTPGTSVGTATSVALSGLTPGATYQWQVRACADAGCAIFTDANNGTHWSFTVVSAPGAFGKVAPADGASGQPTSPTLSWGTASGTVDHYRYCIATTTGCTPNTSVGAATSIALSGLTPGTPYYWQARACADAGCTVFTDANGSGGHWSFTTATGPAGFSKLSPANGTLGHPTNLTLSWDGTTGQGTVTYSYCIKTTNAPCTASERMRGSGGRSAWRARLGTWIPAGRPARARRRCRRPPGWASW